MDYSKKSTKWLKFVLKGNEITQSSGVIQDAYTHSSFEKENQEIRKILYNRKLKNLKK